MSVRLESSTAEAVFNSFTYTEGEVTLDGGISWREAILVRLGDGVYRNVSEDLFEHIGRPQQRVYYQKANQQWSHQSGFMTEGSVRFKALAPLEPEQAFSRVEGIRNYVARTSNELVASAISEKEEKERAEREEQDLFDSVKDALAFATSQGRLTDDQLEKAVEGLEVSNFRRKIRTGR